MVSVANTVLLFIRSSAEIPLLTLPPPGSSPQLPGQATPLLTEAAAALARTNDSNAELKAVKASLEDCRASNAELKAVKASLEDCRADLRQRTLQLDALRARAEADMRAAAARATSEASALANDALAKALRETDAIREAGDESLRRATEEAREAIREAKENAAAAKAAKAAKAEAEAAVAGVTVAAEEAGARHAAELAAVERESGALGERCAGLQARLAEMEVCVCVAARLRLCVCVCVCGCVCKYRVLFTQQAVAALLLWMCFEGTYMCDVCLLFSVFWGASHI